MANRILAFVITALFANISAAQAQSAHTYPARPIRLIVPFPPGGNTDIVARAIGPRLTERWGQQVVIDNRGGANTIIGAELTSNAPPDGYTILLATATTLSINPSVYTKLPYNVARDFAPVAPIVTYTYVIAAHHTLPVNSPQEFIAFAKAKPGQTTYAGSSLSNQLAGALLEMIAGVRMVYVPYKGTGPALLDAIAGRVSVIITGMSTAQPHVKTGKLKLLGICSEKRLASAPDVPAFGELPGMKGYEGGTWFGIVVPAHTPKPIIDKINGAIGAVVSSPDVKAQFAALDYEPYVAKPDAFARFIETDRMRTAKVVKAFKISSD